MSPDPHTSPDELDPDEPKTPLWMPILGLSLFLLALVFALSGTGDEAGAEEGSAGAGAANAPAEAAEEQPAP